MLHPAALSEVGGNVNGRALSTATATATCTVQYSIVKYSIKMHIYVGVPTKDNMHTCNDIYQR